MTCGSFEAHISIGQCLVLTKFRTNRQTSNMQSHFIAVLVAFVAFRSCAANPHLVSAHLKMLDAMSATNEMQRNNPELSSACFNQYISTINDLTETYQQEYDQCESTRTEGASGLLNEYDPLVEYLVSSSYQSCETLLECRSQNGSLDALSCISVQVIINKKRFNLTWTKTISNS